MYCTCRYASWEVCLGLKMNILSFRCYCHYHILHTTFQRRVHCRKFSNRAQMSHVLQMLKFLQVSRNQLRWGVWKYQLFPLPQLIKSRNPSTVNTHRHNITLQFEALTLTLLVPGHSHPSVGLCAAARPQSPFSWTLCCNQATVTLQLHSDSATTRPVTLQLDSVLLPAQSPFSWILCCNLARHLSVGLCAATRPVTLHLDSVLLPGQSPFSCTPVSYTHLRAHET